MRCPFCEKSVIGEKDVVVIVGEGPAHRHCYERDMVNQRSFAGLYMPSLSDVQLNELKDLVLMELNSREQEETHEAVELFA